jgi:hypothetical protein
MSIPETWLHPAIEAAVNSVTAWPVAMTGDQDPPYVIYRREATTREMVLADTLSGTPVADENPPEATFTLEILADSYLQAKTIAAAISAALHRFTGPADDVTIQWCLHEDERDSDAVFLDGREVPTYIVEQTYRVSWYEGS